MIALSRLLTQLVIVGAVLSFGWAHGHYIGDYEFFDSSRLPWTLAFIASLVSASYALGLPDEPAGGYRVAFGSAFAAGVIAALFISIAQLLVGAQLLPRFVVLWSVLFATGWYWLCAAVADDLRRKQFVATRVAVIGELGEIERLKAELSKNAEQPANVVVATDGSEDDLGSVITSARADVVVLDRSAQANESVVSQVVALHGRGMRVRTLSLFYEEWLQKLPVSELERVSLLFDIGELHKRGYGRVKRAFDVIAGLVMVVFTVLCAPLVFACNIVGNRGPLFFKQDRVGRDGEVFRLYKFRTMREGSSENEWTQTNDDRITPFGRVLRRSHLDELPQSLNIITGKLSLIGPRPEQPQYVGKLVEEIPFYDVRHLVRPGLTGWAQVRHPYGASVEDAREKLQYDFYYLRRQGLVLDLFIVLRTVRSTLLGRGR